MKEQRYSIYGFSVITNRCFRTPMAAAPPAQCGGAQAELRFTCAVTAGSCAPAAEQCIYTSPYKNSFGESALQLYADHSSRLMRFPGVADFVLTPGEIACELCDPELDYMVEIYLLGHVFSYYLELWGLPAIHAAAVAAGGQAVLFAADRSAGKSSVVASMLQSGFALLTDDIAALEPGNAAVSCRRAFPQVKLTPEQARLFAGATGGYGLVHPAFNKLSVPAGALGTFAPAALPVAAIYLLERRTPGTEPPGAGGAAETGIELQPLSPGEALVQLVRTSFLAEILDGAGRLADFAGGDMRVGRFHRLAQIAQTVPVKRLRYPSGYELLPQVHAAVLADL